MILTMSLPTDQSLRALRSLIDRMKLSLREASRMVGIDNTVLTDWYHGNATPKSKKSLDKLGHAVKTLEEQERALSPKRGEDLKRVGIRLVRVLPKLVTDGRLLDNEHEMIEVMDWGTSSERNGFVIEDDSMDPDLSIGQKVIADDRPADPNHVVLIETTDGERMVRYVVGVGQTRVYRAADPQFPDYPASKAKSLGVVVEVITPLPGEEEQRHTYKRGMRRKK